MILIAVVLLISLSSCTYIPELMLTTSSSFLNAKIIEFGPNITANISQFKIPPISFDDKVDGVKVSFNLSNITQDPHINWNSNVLKVVDAYSFLINSKNINLTLNGHIEFKIGATPKQKGSLVIEIEKL